MYTYILDAFGLYILNIPRDIRSGPMQKTILFSIIRSSIGNVRRKAERDK